MVIHILVQLLMEENRLPCVFCDSSESSFDYEYLGLGDYKK